MKKRTTSLLIVVLLLVFVITGCQPGTSEVASSNDEPQNLWEEILQRGVLIVGTSADYPPHEFIDEDGEFVGWDMDLIREIGDRLGLEVEIQDLGFDALIASVQGQKVDVAIAGMAATPERKESVDFSLEFFWGEKSFITKVGSGIQFDSEYDIQDYSVGVQAGSTLDVWLQEDMIDEGLMDESQVTRYERAEQIALDVKAGRIEVGFLDFGAASELAANTEDVELAYTGRFGNEEGGAIAIPKGEVELKNAIDEIIEDLFEEGYIDNLNDKWFND